MRRWLAILLLALLPFQFSWAAVSAYCGHESGAASQHVGHHTLDPAHDPAPADVPDADPAGEPADPGASPGFDCGHCHCHGSCASMPAPAGDMAAPARASHPVTPVAGDVRTQPPSPPERPQWPHLA